MIKKIFAGLVFLVVIIAAGAYFLSANMDSLVEAAIETYGTAATKTPVRLDSVKIVLTSGEASMAGLSVGSPDGFEAEKSLFLGSIAVKLDTKSVTGNGPIVIKDITIDKPQVTYEINTKGDNNLRTISKNAQAFASSFSKAKKEKSAVSQSPDGSPSRKVIIESLTVRDGQLSISQPLLKGKTLDAKLPVIRLTNIGKNEGGADPAEVAEIVLEAITNASSQVATSNLTQELGSTIEKAKTLSQEDIEAKGGELLQNVFGK